MHRSKKCLSTGIWGRGGQKFLATERHGAVANRAPNQTANQAQFVAEPLDTSDFPHSLISDSRPLYGGVGRLRRFPSLSRGDVGGRTAALSLYLGGRPVSSAGFRHYQTGWGEFHG